MIDRPKHTILKILVTCAALVASCSNSDFAGSSAKGSNIDCKKNPKQCSSGGVIQNETDGPSRRDIQKNEAVLAVRDISCAFCHAQVSSNIISDFAVTTEDVSAEQTFRKIMFQINHEDGPKGQPLITGNFYLPKGDIPMIDRTKTCVYTAETNVASSSFQKSPLIDTLIKCVQPSFNWGVNSEKFVAKDQVSINPVSSVDEIKAIVGASKLTGSGMALVGDSKVSGISGSASSGFRAASSVSCEGAVVFDGPVFLKDATINTVKGCRIYSTGSIFVFGTTNVSTSSDAANLQLMSPLFVGFDISAGNAEGRLKHEDTSKIKLSRGSTAEVAVMINSDASKLGIIQETGNSNVGYSRVAASAPVIYARHTGAFSGAIIAEHFIGKIGALSFTFDPVFKAGNTAMFPEIKRALVINR